MTTTTKIKSNRVHIQIEIHEAQILAYALRHFAKEMSDADTNARGWAFQMKRLADDIGDTLNDYASKD